MCQNVPIYLFANYYSIFLRITLTEPIFVGKLLVAQKWANIIQNGSICLLLRSSIMVAFFLRIGLLDMSNILHGVEGPQV